MPISRFVCIDITEIPLLIRLKTADPASTVLIPPNITGWCVIIRLQPLSAAVFIAAGVQSSDMTAPVTSESGSPA